MAQLPDTYMDLDLLASAWPNLSHCGHLRSETTDERFSLSIFLPETQIHK